MIYDCFLFCHELDILELRFEILFDKVDTFVLGESEETFMGQPKPLFFMENRERFKRFSSKICHLVIPSIPNCTPEERETFQRNKLEFGVVLRRSSDVVFVNDADEIPNVVAGKGLLSYRPLVRLVPYWSIFYLNNHVQNKAWPHMRVCRGEYLNDHTMSQVRWGRTDAYAYNGGWHFQNLGGPKAIAYKCQSFAHAKNPSPEYQATWQNEEHIKTALAHFGDTNHQSPITSCEQFAQIGPGELFPPYVVDNWGKLKERGLIL